jgi:hypothetical protein
VFARSFIRVATSWPLLGAPEAVDEDGARLPHTPPNAKFPA